MSSEMVERVKYSISIEMEVPSYQSTRYLLDSLVVRFDKKKEQTEREAIQEHSEQFGSIDSRVLNNTVESDSKLKLFVDIFHALAGEDRDDVKKEILIQELVNTGKFTEQEALYTSKRLKALAS